MRGKIAVAATHKIHHPVGAGQAPPATVCYNEYNGLDCCNSRTYPPHPARSAPPSPQGGRLLRGRGGVCPARNLTAITTLRVICRGGIYAARCNHTANAIYRVNRTGRIYASPTNLPGISYHRKILRQPQNTPAGYAPPATV